MSSEWLHSVQDVAHYSIQTSNTGTDYQDSNDESIPLLRDNERSCVRNLWIVFFSIFLGVGLFTGTYLLITEATDWSISQSYYSLITRKGWKADKVNLVNSTVPLLQLPLRKVLLTKTNSPECVNEDECSKQVYEVQKDHVTRLKEPDIIYNFLIAGDGQTYEGRGWKYQALVSNSGDKHTLVVAFLGIFNETLPSKKQIGQARSFLQVAESKGKLSQCYTIESEHNLNQSKNEGIFNDVISHLKAYFTKKHNLC
ncbi:hypothetical protein ILUMI_20763 [Ignelater luminosus]|uniref:Peptidoglycan recognition protein family domain-containing protein n=1 Tax=Ignelater luminosus TaxID=2038154 RepID=A0A8K0G4J7_IGNLU|nr:hypothetical protein ILUMI_20763 [Ignelater luminosus]